ncbi:MAG: hypothetical protein E6G32_09940 [Actinobacteria bacterium]|nr:MAG: hypothetical protein E6G32_09940 [Actinomycetota bacterium]
MSAIPFTAYDIFAYLSSGFFVIASADLALPGNWLVNAQLSVIQGVVWIAVAYITGHVMAQISSTLLEKGLVKRILGTPEVALFGESRRRRLFPGYFETLPERIAERVRERAAAEAEIYTVGRDLFYFCDAKARKEPSATTHLTIFLGMYGFARNVCVAALVSTGVFLVGLFFYHAPRETTIFLACASFVTAGFLLYRYLKFLRVYALEVFTAYAALDPLPTDPEPPALSKFEIGLRRVKRQPPA